MPGVRIDPILRERIRCKFGGRCSYCGKKLARKWQVDHADPAFRGYTEEELEEAGKTRGMDHLKNLMPACVRCNQLKRAFSLEEFRQYISLALGRLRMDSPGFRLAEDYGLVAPKAAAIVFWFERFK